MDVHPYEEAQGFQRLLDMPGYDVAALVEKSGKSAGHIYARLSLLQLIPTIAEAFTAERLTASHANLLARLPQEAQATAYDECWRKDWQDKEPHLLPAKHLSAWIQAKLTTIKRLRVISIRFWLCGRHGVFSELRETFHKPFWHEAE